MAETKVQWIGAMDCERRSVLHYGFVSLWVCGFVGLWACGFVGLWACGLVALWACGLVGLWVMILDIFLELLVKKTEFPMIRHFAEIILIKNNFQKYDSEESKISCFSPLLSSYEENPKIPIVKSGNHYRNF